jgi:hypothetical protein
MEQKDCDHKLPRTISFEIVVTISFEFGIMYLGRRWWGPEKSRTHDSYLFRFRKVGNSHGTLIKAVPGLSR